ncbi:MAG: hypothetical protein Q7S11_01015 [bacterium]|nr:hypothetical protein [bacterium]
MKEVPCDVPTLIGRTIVSVTKTIIDEDGLDVVRVSFNLNDNSVLAITRVGGEAKGIDWAQEISIRHNDEWIADISFE